MFNVRIYGLLISNNQVLVSDEIYFGKKITKFPGGGLQFGESTIDCIKREFREELQLDILVLKHFYTVDFFQASAFNPSQQVISIYYLVSAEHADTIQVVNKKFEFPDDTNGAQVFRWIPVSLINPSEFTFPIDKKVAELLNPVQGS